MKLSKHLNSVSELLIGIPELPRYDVYHEKQTRKVIADLFSDQSSQEVLLELEETMRNRFGDCVQDSVDMLESLSRFVPRNRILDICQSIPSLNSSKSRLIKILAQKLNSLYQRLVGNLPNSRQIKLIHPPGTLEKLLDHLYRHQYPDADLRRDKETSDSIVLKALSSVGFIVECMYKELTIELLGFRQGAANLTLTHKLLASKNSLFNLISRSTFYKHFIKTSGIRYKLPKTGTSVQARAQEGVPTTNNFIDIAYSDNSSYFVLF